ncbi:hypothetical protein EHM69_12300 [candidate division KSB1 bacterium]|nr:MAG: hypothetical protein EHM69_12300 [candidate division KSB1 bacterium]
MYVPRIAVFWAQYRRPVIALVVTGLVVLIGFVLGLKGSLVAALAALVGLLTSAFTGLAALLGLIPWIGPLILKALAIPAIWLMNAAGYFTALLLMKQGHTKSVVDSRVITYVLLIGVVIGYIIGKII